MRSLAMIPILLSIVTLMEMPQITCHSIIRRDIFLLEHTLDLRLSAFDDQYEGCVASMEAELPGINKTEFAKNKYFAKAWKAARSTWEERNDTAAMPSGLRDEHAIAILAYTSHGELYKLFNRAVREAGQSADYYQKNFKFKTLHFLLTRALQILEAQELKPQCPNVYRGYRDIRYKTKRQKLVRFGQFVSTALGERNGLKFGQHTFFEIETCYGVNIENYSAYPEIKEVMIPPYEKFMVTNFTRTPKQNLIRLHSVDKLSVYNCEYLKARKCTSWKCFLKSAASTRSSSSILLVLAVFWAFVMAAPCFPCSTCNLM